MAEQLTSFEKFRRRTAAPPPAAAPGPAGSPFEEVPGLGRLPLQPGTAVRLTDFERQSLKKLGWKEGDPVPGNLAEAIEAGRRSAADTAGMTPVDPATPPLEYREVKIEDLDPQSQRRLSAAMQDMLAREAARRAAPSIPDAAPGVQEALNLASAPPPQPAPSPAPPPPPPPVESSPAAEPAAGPGVLSPTGAAGFVNCPHCGWDLERPDTIEPAPEDIYGYLTMVLGGAGVRFTKTLRLFGGRVAVTFRALTVGEANLALHQVACDLRANRIIGDGEYLRALQDYRMVMTIERLQVEGKGAIEIPAATDTPADAPFETALPTLHKWLIADVLPSETLRRAVGMEFYRFQGLVEKCEARAADPNFWQGIGRPG
jgi:hypothetical protein